MSTGLSRDCEPILMSFSNLSVGCQTIESNEPNEQYVLTIVYFPVLKEMTTDYGATFK